ncbi:hypothetical protein EC991_005702 [Linnemannia zychae]|nr:hypothetical protein EC991_005702 [Linnemannia zychae]
MKGTPSPPPQDQGQEKKHMDHDYSPEDTGLVGLSPSQLPAYPRPIATPQQLYAAAAAPIAPLSYRQQQVHPRQDDYAQQGHFTSRSDYTNNYNVYNDNYINNAMWSYPAIRNDGQEELAHKGDYPSGSRATSIAVKGGDYPPYFDAFSEEIGYKGEYPPYAERVLDCGGGGGDISLGGSVWEYTSEQE